MIRKTTISLKPGFFLCSIFFLFVLSGSYAQTQLGIDIDGEAAGDQSSHSVSLSLDGSRVAIGAYFNDGNGSNAGHVRVYEYSGGSWTQLGTDIDGENSGDQAGRNISLSSDGNRVAIGAHGNDGNGGNSGHVRVYEYNSGSWTQLGADIDGEAADDQSGWAVSLSANGSRVAIGARFNDGNGSNAGHVRVFEYGGASWTQVGSDIDGEAVDDNFGWSVSLSANGNRLVAGGPNNDVNGSNTGHVRIFELSGGSWLQMGPDIDGENGNDNFGWSVSLSGDGNTAAVGGRYNDGGGYNSGHARVFGYSGGSWNQIGADIDGEAVNDYFGWSVSLSYNGDRVAIGGSRNDGNGSDAGHVRIFDYDAGSWSQVGPDIDGEAADDQSGVSVSLSADGWRLAIGAHLNDANGNNSGHTRIYSLPTPPSILTIPTLSQWALIILALLMLNVGALAIMVKQGTLITTNGHFFSLSSLPFDKRSFANLLLLTGGMVAAAFSIAILGFDYELTNADVPCSILAVPLLAYFLFQLRDPKGEANKAYLSHK